MNFVNRLLIVHTIKDIETRDPLELIENSRKAGREFLNANKQAELADAAFAVILDKLVPALDQYIKSLTGICEILESMDMRLGGLSGEA